MKEICSPDDCTGCAACANSCGHNAISIFPDKYGYLHPIIDQDLCIDCGLCSRICPNNSTPKYYEPICAYRGCAKNASEQLLSTSGGIASAISRFIIRRGGVVFGCSGKNVLEVRHIKATSESDVDMLRGSKYVQSLISDTFSEAKKELLEGKEVLFIGTPCQIAGLKSYIPAKLQNKLITVDFVCHGVPSQRILNDALKELRVDNKANIQFRVKETKLPHKKIVVNPDNVTICPRDKQYKTMYGIFSTKGNRRVYSPFPQDNYIVGFLKALFYRESCYGCHYAQIKRVSDITLGDYRKPRDAKEKIEGENRLLSKIIINTVKGDSIIAGLCDDIIIQKIDVAALVGGQLVRPMPMHPNRSLFLQVYLTHGFSEASKIIYSEKREIRYHIIFTNIRDILYRLPIVYSILKMIRK